MDQILWSTKFLWSIKFHDELQNLTHFCDIKLIWSNFFQKGNALSPQINLVNLFFLLFLRLFWQTNAKFWPLIRRETLLTFVKEGVAKFQPNSHQKSCRHMVASICPNKYPLGFELAIFWLWARVNPITQTPQTNPWKLKLPVGMEEKSRKMNERLY